MGGTSPCASCKLLRRRCAKDCIFAPYFPPDDPHKFAIVHKVFGASNISKMLQELPVHQRGDAVSSLVYEANARMRDPVYGCVGAISYLQNQVSQLQMQLAVAQAEILCIQMQQEQQEHEEISSTVAAAIGLPASTIHEIMVDQLQQQQPLVDDQKLSSSSSVFLSASSATSNFSNLQQYLNFASTAAGAGSVIHRHHHHHQDPLKRESLWT